MKKETVLSSKVIYQGHILKLRVDTILTADGRKSTREIIEHSDSIGVIAVDADGNILLVKQFRAPPDKVLLEIPAGGIDPGEDPPTAVVREMREETGMRPGKVEQRLTGYYLSPGFCNEYLHVYLATDLSPDPLSAEDTAGIELERVLAAEIPGLIADGKIEDSKSIAALLWYMNCNKAK